MRRIHHSILLAGLGCLLSIGQVNQAQGQSSAEVLFGPTSTQIVVRLETTFTVPDSPDFQQIYSYQSGEPNFWEADLVELQSPFFGDGSPGLVIECFSGALEQGLQVVIPNTYLRRNATFRISSNRLLPPDGVEGVTWSFWFTPEVPMSLEGKVQYDAASNSAHVSVTFSAGILPHGWQSNARSNRVH